MHLGDPCNYSVEVSTRHADKSRQVQAAGGDRVSDRQLAPALALVRGEAMEWVKEWPRLNPVRIEIDPKRITIAAENFPVDRDAEHPWGRFCPGLYGLE